MKTIREKSKEWCGEHSNNYCKEQCDGCWHVESAFGCEQHNMELAYEAGANYVLEQIEKLTNNQNWCAFPKQSHKELKELIEQLKK